jgi:predicted RNA-binding protein with PIN domain
MVKDPPLVYVATSDRVSGDVSFGSGAVMIKAEQFIRNIIKTDEEARHAASCVPRASHTD